MKKINDKLTKRPNEIYTKVIKSSLVVKGLDSIYEVGNSNLIVANVPKKKKKKQECTRFFRDHTKKL